MKGVDSRVVTRARLTSRSGSELDRERWVAFGCVGVPLIKRMCMAWCMACLWVLRRMRAKDEVG